MIRFVYSLFINFIHLWGVVLMPIGDIFLSKFLFWFFRKYLLFNPLSLFHKLHIWEAYLMRLSHFTCHPVKCWDFFLTLVPVTGILTAIEGFCTPALKWNYCERDEEFYRIIFGKKFSINKWDGIWNTYFEIKNSIGISAKFYCILFDLYIFKLGKARIMRKSLVGVQLLHPDLKF